MRRLLFPLAGAILLSAAVSQSSANVRDCEQTWKKAKSQRDAFEWRLFESICKHNGGQCPSRLAAHRCCNSTECSVGECSCFSGCPYLVCHIPEGWCPPLTIPKHGNWEKLNGNHRYRLHCKHESMVRIPVNGNGEIYCNKELFRWVGDEYRCRGRCDKPDITGTVNIDDHLMLAHQNTKFGYGGLRVRLACKPGYRQIGKGDYVCNDENIDAPKWTGSIHCEKQRCILPRVGNSNIPLPLRYSFNRTVKISCKSGYQLVGAGTLRCLDRGNGSMHWSANAPRCDPKPCSTQAFLSLQVPQAKFMPKLRSGTDDVQVKHGTKVNVSCHSHYQLRGTEQVMCYHGDFVDINSTGRRQGPSGNKCKAPCCSIKQSNFSSLVTIVDQVSCDPSNHDLVDTISIVCPNCYKTINRNAHCHAVPQNPRLLRWDVIPHCRRYTCSNVSEFEDDSVVSDSSQVTHHCDDVIRYSCQGSELVGPSERRCVPGGKWSSTERVSCISRPVTDLTCPQLVSPSANLTISVDHYRAGGTAKFSCAPCLALKGARNVRCIFDQALRTSAWNGMMPTCKLDNCPPFRPPPLMVVSSNTIRCGARVNVSCQPGYLAVDVNGREARDDLQFVCQGQSHAEPWKQLPSSFSYCKKSIACQPHRSCPDYMECNAGRTLCICKENSTCTSDRNSKICATNGRTYPSRCHLAIENCKQRTNIEVVQNSSCTYAGTCWEAPMASTSNCRYPRTRYTHKITPDYTSSRCQRYTDGGQCHDTSDVAVNSFKCAEACKRQCSARVCSLPKDPGPCNVTENRWFYDEATQKCKKFSYSGCGGNQNNFKTKHQCKHVAFTLLGCRNVNTPEQCSQCANSNLSHFCDRDLIARVYVERVLTHGNDTQLTLSIDKIFFSRLGIGSGSYIFTVKNLCKGCWNVKSGNLFRGLIAAPAPITSQGYLMTFNGDIFGLHDCELPIIVSDKNLEKYVCQQCRHAQLANSCRGHQ